MSGEQIRLQVPPILFGVNSWMSFESGLWIERKSENCDEEDDELAPRSDRFCP